MDRIELIKILISNGFTDVTRERNSSYTEEECKFYNTSQHRYFRKTNFYVDFDYHRIKVYGSGWSGRHDHHDISDEAIAVILSMSNMKGTSRQIFNNDLNLEDIYPSIHSEKFLSQYPKSKREKLQKKSVEIDVLLNQVVLPTKINNHA